MFPGNRHHVCGVLYDEVAAAEAVEFSANVYRAESEQPPVAVLKYAAIPDSGEVQVVDKVERRQRLDVKRKDFAAARSAFGGETKIS